LFGALDTRELRFLRQDLPIVQIPLDPGDPGSGRRHEFIDIDVGNIVTSGGAH